MEASLMKKLAEAKSDAEKAAIEKQLADAKSARAHSSGGGSRPSAAPKDKDKDKKESTPSVAPDLIKKKKDVSLDPLEGLKL
jgi:hypothetical protein